MNAISLKKTCVAAALASAALAATSAQAAFVTAWDYKLDLSWDSAIFGPGGGLPAQSASLLSWGAAGGDHTNPNQDSGSSRSALAITGTTAQGSVTTNAIFDTVTTATVTHYNNTLSSAFATLQSAVMKAAVTLKPNVAGIDSDPVINYSFDIHFAETPNDGSCAPGSQSNCDDIFIIAFSALNQSFEYDDIEYFLSLAESTHKLNTLPPGACTEAGAAAGCLGFMTKESEFTPAQFALAVTGERLVTNPVPEPGVLGLLAAGMLGAGMMRRRRA